MFDNNTVGIIITISTLCTSLIVIFNFIIKPINFLKKKTNDTIEEEIKRIITAIFPSVISEYNLNIDDGKITALEELTKKIDKNNEEQQQEIKSIKATILNSTRQEITTIYYSYKDTKKIPFYIKENLDELYIDYIANGGNHYVEKLYGRMCTWEVIDCD